MTHHHKGKSSERFLYKNTILRELDIRHGQIVLDACCGNGYMAREFSKVLNSTGKVYALDPDREAIKMLQRETEGTRIEAVEGDITRTTPIEGSSIDVIYLSAVFHGFSKNQIASFQEEAMRLLKPNAMLAIVEIEKQDTPFGPPLDMRFSPEKLKQTITLFSKNLVKVGQFFYMQTFENKMKD